MDKICLLIDRYITQYAMRCAFFAADIKAFEESYFFSPKLIIL